MASRPPWFVQWPDLAAWELARFTALGLPACVDEEAKAAGRFAVKTEVEFRGSLIAVDVCYPSEYPELPPTVLGPPGLLDRHQNPFDGNLCLLERPLDDWPAGSWGGANLIQERLAALLRDTEVGPEAVRQSEAPIPEPYTAYYDYALGPVVLMPGELASPDGPEGTVRLRMFVPTRFACIVETVSGRKSKSRVNEILSRGPTIHARWRRLDRPPPTPDAASLVKWARADHPGFLSAPIPKKLANSRHLPKADVEVAAFVFSEEGPGVGEQRDAWLFLFLQRRGNPFLAHCQIVSEEERSRRIADLGSLSSRRVVMVGAGSLGSHIAVELARAGTGRVQIIDYDRFEANNAVRHALGIEWSGAPKAWAVAGLCQRANPFCLAEAHQICFGAGSWTGESSADQLARLLEDADIAVETTGSHQLQRFVARTTHELGIPLVSAWLTEGFWGGELVRIRPGRSCCFRCFAEAYATGQLPRAAAGPENPIVAQGCSQPTVSGAGFDALEIAALTARLTIQSLLPSGYADAAWDYAAVTLRDETRPGEGQVIATETIKPSKDCARCGRGAG